MENVTSEEWRPVVGLEGYYEVSSFGRVRSLYRNSMRIMRPSYSNTGGYPLYILTVNGVRYPRYGHHMVAEAFIGPRPEGQEVRHVYDPDPRNCARTNLAYGTSGENKIDQVRHGTHYEGSRNCCDAGHEFTAKNTRIDYWPDGSFKQRVCRACANERTKDRRRNLTEVGRPCTSEEGCNGPVWAKGLCAKHYQRQWRDAHPDAKEADRRRAREQYVPRDPRIVCRHCGETFLRQSGMSSNRQYCSDECFVAARRDRQRRYRTA